MSQLHLLSWSYFWRAHCVKVALARMWYVPVEVVECTASHWAECHRTLQWRKIQYDLCFTVTPFDGHPTKAISRRKDKTTNVLLFKPTFKSGVPFALALCELNSRVSNSWRIILLVLVKFTILLDCHLPFYGQKLLALQLTAKKRFKQKHLKFKQYLVWYLFFGK